MTLFFNDVETFGSVRIERGLDQYLSGVRPLIWTYCDETSAVETWDIASGAPMPNKFQDNMLDERVTKVAHNAQFDRGVARVAFNWELPANQWHCTMARAYAHGLPGALEVLGPVLGLPADMQKLLSGKKLIQLFCVPATKGGPRGNQESHPAEWRQFLEYGAQDTAALREIYKRLPKHNYIGEHYDLWVCDQKINERGFCIDQALCRQAVDICQTLKDDLNAEVEELTNGVITAATQTKRVLHHIVGEYGFLMLNMQADTIKKMLAEDATLTGDARRLLEIRLESAMTSQSKYKRALERVGADGRMRYTLQYSGAGRTGRWCLTGDHEVLTLHGWQRLDEWKGGRIACWTPERELISFQKAKALQFPFSGTLVHHKSKRISQLATPEHVMPCYGPSSGLFQPRTVAVLKRAPIPFTGTLRSHSGMFAEQLRVLVMVQADGYFDAHGAIKLHFKKARKVKRCQKLLKHADIVFSRRRHKDAITFRIARQHQPLWLAMFSDKTFGSWLLHCDAQVFFDELELWDGYRCGPNSVQYSTTDRANADWVQALAHVSGRSATITVKRNREKGWADCYCVNVWLRPGNRHEIRKPPTDVQHIGTVYCAETPTGFFLVRREGRVWVTGNSGRGFQPQNMPRPKREAAEVLNEIIPAIKDGSLPLLVNDVNQACADAIRGVIVAAEGCELLVGDWSNIEGCCLAWEANAAWKIRALEANYAGTGPDLYVHLYSNSFGVAIDDVTGSQRQIGKGMELSLGYGGGVGAFTNVAASYGLDLDELGRVVPGIVSAKVYGNAEATWRRAYIRGDDLGLEPDVFIACDALKQVWRTQNPEIVQMWWDVERAVKWAIMSPGSVHNVARCKIWRTPAWLIIELPSGRRLLYAQPEVRNIVEKDEETGEFEERQVIRYMAAKNKQWRRDRSYGGKFVENITQAIANDVLRAAMLRADAAGYQQVLHVHDEIVTEGPIGFYDLNDFLKLMEEPLKWSAGLPLKAAGYVATRYKKD